MGLSSLKNLQDKRASKGLEIFWLCRNLVEHFKIFGRTSYLISILYEVPCIALSQDEEVQD